MDAAEDVIVGVDMSARQFDEATPREIQRRLDARRERDELEWRRTAQLAAWVLQSFGSTVTTNKLLGKPEPFHL